MQSAVLLGWCCLSLRLSVYNVERLTYRNIIDWITSKVFNGYLAWRLRTSQPQDRQSIPRGTFYNVSWNKGRVAVFRRKTTISLKRGKIGPWFLVSYWTLIESCVRAFACSEINDLGWPWTVMRHSVSNTCVCWGPPRKFQLFRHFVVSLRQHSFLFRYTHKLTLPAVQ